MKHELDESEHCTTYIVNINVMSNTVGCDRWIFAIDRAARRIVILHMNTVGPTHN